MAYLTKLVSAVTNLTMETAEEWQVKFSLLMIKNTFVTDEVLQNIDCKLWLRRSI